MKFNPFDAFLINYKFLSFWPAFVPAFRASNILNYYSCVNVLDCLGTVDAATFTGGCICACPAMFPATTFGLGIIGTFFNIPLPKLIPANKGDESTTSLNGWTIPVW